MTEKAEREMRKQTSTRTTGAVFLLLAVLIFVIGLLVHYAQVGSLPVQEIISVQVSQIHLLFAEYVAVGFFAGMFLVVGITYIRSKDGEKVETEA
jgi:uncharacterized membrane protein